MFPLSLLLLVFISITMGRARFRAARYRCWFLEIFLKIFELKSIFSITDIMISVSSTLFLNTSSTYQSSEVISLVGWTWLPIDEAYQWQCQLTMNEYSNYGLCSFNPLLGCGHVILLRQIIGGAQIGSNVLWQVGDPWISLLTPTLICTVHSSILSRRHALLLILFLPWRSDDLP